MSWSSSACTWYTRGRPHKYCFYQLYPQFPYLVWRHNTAWTPWLIDHCSPARNGCIYICKVVITIKQCISVKLYLLDSLVLPPPNTHTHSSSHSVSNHSHSGDMWVCCCHCHHGSYPLADPLQMQAADDDVRIWIISTSGHQWQQK